MLVAGLALGTAAFALPTTSSRSEVRNGGWFLISQWASVDSLDPALQYSPAGWLFLEATCAKLMNYPDKPAPEGLRPVPEVAAGYPRISRNGRVYTFTIRRGLRFSNGAAVTARSFARQIERLLDPDMHSPAVDSGYVQDIVGAGDVLSGKTSKPSGVTASGNRLVIRLVRRIPDFTARLAMPFFCAVPPSLPADPEGVDAFPSAGPYYVSDYRRGQRLVLRRNTYYRGTRPQHVLGFIAEFTSTQAEMVDRIRRGRADWGWMDAVSRRDHGRALVRSYRSRLFVQPSQALRFFVLNTKRPLFRSARVRQAVNYAVDRRALVALHGFRSAQPTDQYIPVGFPGFRNARVYPFRPNLRRARALAGARLRGKKAVLYTAAHPLPLSMAQVVKRNLAALGLQVEIKAFPLGLLFDKLAAPGEPFDIAWGVGFAADYGDPYTFINLFFESRAIGASNFSRFSSRAYDRAMARAGRLSGTKRLRAYGNLDVDLARHAAPLVAYGIDNAWTFVSRRLDPRCRVLRPELDLAAVCLRP